MQEPNNDSLFPTTSVGGALAGRAGGGTVAVESSRAIAEAQAAMFLAKKFPRDQRASVDRVIMACTRPSLAERAIYSFARGGTEITGPTIHIAKAIAREWGNLAYGVRELSNEDGVSEVEAFCFDLETNVRESRVFVVKHWRDTRQGGYAIKDQRDIYELVANQGARRLRACILGVIPGDIVEMATNQAEVTLRSRLVIDEKFFASLLEKFAAFDVTKAMIEAKIQRNLDTLTPAQAVMLGKAYNAIRDGMAEVTDFFVVDGDAPEAGGAGGKKGTQGLKDAMKKNEASAAGRAAAGSTAQSADKPADAPAAGGGASEVKQDANAAGDGSPDPAKTGEGAPAAAGSAAKPAATAESAAPAKTQTSRARAAAGQVTMAKISEKLNDAFAKKQIDLLDAHADLIQYVADETQQNELREQWKKMHDELAGDA